MKKLIILVLCCFIARVGNASCGFYLEPTYNYNQNIYYPNVGLYPPNPILINYGDSLRLWAHTTGICNGNGCAALDSVYWKFNGSIITSVYNGSCAAQLITHNAGVYELYCIFDNTYHMHYIYNIVANPTGVPENFLQNMVTLHPNPVNDKLEINISVLKQSDLQYDIFDMTGKKLKTFSQNNFIGEFKQSENFESLASGVYFFQLTLDGERIVKKIVKQ